MFNLKNNFLFKYCGISFPVFINFFQHEYIIYIEREREFFFHRFNKEIAFLFCPGFPLNDQLFQMITRRYSDTDGNMDFDNFIGCLVRLDAMCRK